MTDCCGTYVHGMAARAPKASSETASADKRKEFLDSAMPAEAVKVSLTTDVDRHDIRLTLDGNEDAYARLVERYEAQVFAQMWRFTRDPRVLEELVQDVFVEAYLSLARFRGEAPFLHWLRRIATRVGYRFWKHERRDRDRRAALRQHAPGMGSYGKSPAPSEAAEAMFDMLARLAPKDRLVLTLYYLDDCDTKQIAEQTGWNPTLVRVRIHRACRRLRRLLTEAEHE
jgi:RNA polymerase sigma-70 factor, ECF subfamily